MRLMLCLINPALWNTLPSSVSVNRGSRGTVSVAIGNTVNRVPWMLGHIHR
jgi:hypothetical protein